MIALGGIPNKRMSGRPDIDVFEAVMTREDRTKGFFVAFDYTADALARDRRLLPQERQSDHRADGS